MMTMADPAAYMTEGENTSIGIYGDVVLRPVDRLALTGGLRWTKDKKEFCATNVDPTFGFLQILGPDTLGQSICDTQKSDKVTYRGVIDFHAAADVLIYASYATGYKGGGFNSSVLGSGLFGIDPPFTLASFDPETSKSAEIGVKAGLFNGDGQLNIALYKTKYKDLQLLDTGLSLRIDNIANVDSDGAEVEFSLRPTSIEELSISTSYAFNDSKIDAPGLAIDGSVLNAAPKHTFAGTLQYAHDIGSLGEIAWFFGYTWQDDIIFDINGARVPQEAYGVADASVRFTPRNGRFDLTFRANNIFDKEYLISGQDPLALGLPTTGRADPFMFMFQLKAYFGDR